MRVLPVQKFLKAAGEGWRIVASCVLTIPYVAGFIAAAIIACAVGIGLAIATAARIGWADARRRGGHGAA